MVSDAELRGLCRELMGFWEMLEADKLLPAPTERVGSNPNRGGPRPVGGRATELDMMLTLKLRVIAADCAESINARRAFGDKSAVEILRFISFNAHSISILDHFEDAIWFELAGMRRELRGFFTPVASTRRTRLAMSTAEDLHTAATTAENLISAYGLNLDRDKLRKQITYWANSGKIAEYWRADGVRVYKQCEVTAVLLERLGMDNYPRL